MLQDTKVRNPMTVVVTPQPESEPMFSEEIVAMVQDRVYEVLRAHLERTRQIQAVELLDDLIVLSTAAHGTGTQYVKDQIIGETIGHASHHVLAMGGNWGG